nr:hypothetical protein Iba_chr06bCG1260 [Ipomoea batatas]
MVPLPPAMPYSVADRSILIQCIPGLNNSRTRIIVEVVHSFRTRHTLHSTYLDPERQQEGIHRLHIQEHIHSIRCSIGLVQPVAVCLKDYGPMKGGCSVLPTEFHSSFAELPRHNSCQQIEQNHSACPQVFSHEVTDHNLQKLASEHHP